MNSIEGQLNIDLYPPHKSAARVELSSSRPLQASRMFIGKTPEQALSTIPLLFNICGVAQSRAALGAIEKARGTESSTQLDIARDMLVLVENAKEHLFRIFIDWPEFFDLKTFNNNLPYLSQLLPAFKSSLFHDGEAFKLDSRLNNDLENTGYLIDKLDQYLQQHVFTQSTEDWLQIKSFHDLQQWAQRGDSIAAHSVRFICEQNWTSQGLTDCQQLPALDDEILLEKFNADDAQQFIEQPRWQGNCYETTALSRQFEQPLIHALHKEFNSTLLTRWLARLVELANIPQQLHDMQQQLNNNQTDKTANTGNKKVAPGLAQIEAARGRLIHHVEIEQGIISNYQILAPTEWNFHPQGLVAKSLCSLTRQHGDELEKLAHLMINAIDPCVGYQLRIH